MSKKEELLSGLSKICEQLQGMTKVAIKHAAHIHRNIGELLIRFANTAAAKDTRSFNAMTEAERQKYRDTVEGINRKSLDEISKELESRGFQGLGLSGTSLYNAMRIAVNYTEGDLTKFVERGASLTKLLTAAALKERDNREEALSIENIHENNLEEFRLLVESIGENGGIKPESAAGKKAAATKKEAIQLEEAPREPTEKKQKTDKAPRGVDTPAKMLDKMADHMEDKLIGQMADLAIVMKDFKDLDPKDQQKVTDNLERLHSHILALAAGIRLLYTVSIQAGAIDDLSYKDITAKLG